MSLLILKRYRFVDSLYRGYYPFAYIFNKLYKEVARYFSMKVLSSVPRKVSQNFYKSETSYEKILSLCLTLLIPTFCSANSGMYVGAGIGANVLTGNQSVTIGALNEGRYPLSYGLKDNAASGELLAGWGHFWGPYYLSVEALYSFLNANSEFKSTLSGHQEERINTKLKDGYGAALRFGYQLQNNILMYIRMGWESRRISIDFRDLDNVFPALNRGYRSNAFVPGLGMEIKTMNNLFLRLELRSAFYQYKNLAVEQSRTNYTRVTTKPRLHTLLVGLVYRF